MTPLQIAEKNLAKLTQELDQAKETVTEYQSRQLVLEAQIESTKKFIADNTPAEPVPPTVS